ncbi:hypothetical protein [Bradyrhizobium sp. SZCCHNRI2010]|uniref:hypothetical protein n=1 Tax=Bradyrhizobium sp. SZCCHNRI2010 TaxID=3057283 RepID=UPI0028EDCC2F|nr:hypothetical protein [Bradyrhizobium sp. SZCCHNRI2010]
MLDFGKPMQTREGRPARLIGRGFWNHDCGPLLFAISFDGVEKLGYRDEDGRYPRSLRGCEEQSRWDIINSPTPDKMVIVQVRRGMAEITQVPDGVVVKLMDYDVHDDEDRHDLITDETGKLCRVELHGPAGEYSVWPFA